MIKIEKLTDNAIATIDGATISLGQLLTHEEYKLLKVEVGTVTVSIDEKELVLLIAPEEEELKPEDPALSVEPDSTSKVLSAESLLAPAAKVTVPKAKVTKPAK